MAEQRKGSNVTDEQTTGLPSDWKPPLRDLVAKVWADLPEEKRERLEGLDRERDAEGNKTWQTSLEDDADDETWTVLWLRSLDGDDPRPDERIGLWPKAVHDRALADSRAIADEHHVD